MYEFDADFVAKLDALRAEGVAPYPNGLEQTHVSTDLHRAFDGVDDPTTVDGFDDVAVAGRLMFRNKMGKAMFLRLQDRGDTVVIGHDDDGNPIHRHGIIQVWVQRDRLGVDAFNQLKKLDIGDFVHARGPVIRTRTGELTIHAQSCQLAGKILETFPDRYHGVQDVELKARRRYVDLFMNPETRAAFKLRSRILRYIRNFLEERDYLEVETPMMQPIPGGAAARPFVTHHNALDLELFLRIAPELYLKRLLVGGLERVFEINRNFRNEGISVKHNPEFTMIELYQAWATYTDLMDLTEELLRGLVRDVVRAGEDNPSLVVEFGDHTVDFGSDFRRAGMDELICEKTELTADQMRDPAALEAFWRAHQSVDDDDRLPTDWGHWWELLFETYVEHTLVSPTFVTRFPAAISPLARRNDEDPELTDRFELIVATWELANAFSELNDPVDQAARFEAQVQARDAGDDEAMYFDADYVRALSYGMPPAAGEGIGIDRLVMLLTGRTTIREVILFPTLRPEKTGETSEADAD